MQRRRYDSHRRLAWLLFFLLSLPLNTASAQNRPRVPDHYRKYFAHYVDKRSITEWFLNQLGFTRQEMGRSFALIAGVSYYPNMGPLEQHLKPAAEDIRKLQEYLRRYEFFDEIVVLQNQDMNYENLTYFLQSYFPQRLKQFPKSRFLFVYSGHGITEGSRGYLLRNTAQNLSDKVNSINLDVVRVLFQEVVESGHHVLALINSCYSGAFLKRSFGRTRFVPKYKGAHAITAGGAGELTWHDPTIGTGSIFFEKFFAGLDGRADIYPKNPDGRSGDGLITVDELTTYLKQEVQISTDQDQNPQAGDISKDGSLGGFFFLDRRRRVERREVAEWRPKRATRFGVDADKVFHEGQAYLRSKDYASAEASFRQAARGGHARAMNFLGYQYIFGIGVEKDSAEALRWFRRGAKAGDRTAMGLLGYMYSEGQGVEQDYAEALRWYRRGAEAGNSVAMNSLGRMYAKGLGVEEDEVEATHWYRRGAEAGNSAAMNNLGYQYEHGLGVEQDYAEALRWYRKAASLGQENAKEAVTRLRGER